MSIASVAQAVLAYVADVIVVDCEQPVPDRILMYHQSPPDDCCTNDGALAVWWSSTYLSTTFPGSNVGAASPCPARPVVQINVDYRICWKVPDVSQAGVIANEDARWNADAIRLGDVADCVMRAFMRLQCGDGFAPTGDPDRDALTATLRNEVGDGSAIRFERVVPTGPDGDCAGVRWSVYLVDRLPPTWPES